MSKTFELSSCCYFRLEMPWKAEVQLETTCMQFVRTALELMMIKKIDQYVWHMV